MDSDSDVWARIAAVAGPPVWVKKLTCVKFSAQARRDVYRTRPTFEQEHWLRVIREAPDPEAAMLATVGLPHDLAGEAHELALPLPTRAWRSVRFRAARLGLPTALRASVRYRDFRRFKGL